MSKLVLLGGPVGVGKTSTLKCLSKQLSNAGFLDADAVWRFSEDLNTDEFRKHALDNVNAVMKGYFRAGVPIGIVS